MKRAGLVLFILVFWAAAAPLALAQRELPGAGSLSLRGPHGESHGWVVMPVDGAGKAAAVVHLPPRRDPERRDSGGDADDGSLHVAAVLPDMPEQIAAWDNLLWMVFASKPDETGRRQRSVLSLAAQRGPLGGSWISESEGERLPMLPSLPGDGTLVGFAGSANGPLAMIQQRADSTGRPRYVLLQFSRSVWRPVQMPARWWQGGTAGSDEPARMELIAGPAGPQLMVLGRGVGGVWVAKPVPPPNEEHVEGDSEPAEIETEWTWTSLRTRADGATDPPVPVSPVFLVSGQYIYAAAARSGKGVDIVNPSIEGFHVLRTMDPPPPFGVVPLDQVGRIAFVWQEQAKARATLPGRSPRDARTHIAEMSVFSGEVMYDGPAQVQGPVSSDELRLLAVVLVGLMVVVVAVVLRPEPAGPALTLPKGVQLAEPGRRVIGAAVDLLIAAAVAAAMLGVPVTQLLTVNVLFGESGGVEAMLLIVGVGFALSTLGDGLFGRSIGKAITGCEVVCPGPAATGQDGIVEPRLVRPSLWRAALRNLVCWALPPVAMWGLANPDHRHRGDIAAGTAVVVRVEEEPEG